MFDGMTLEQRAKKLEAFETDQWAADAIMEVELFTPFVVDPCVGTGMLARSARAAGYSVLTNDIFDWSKVLDCAPPDHIGDWLNRFEPIAPFIDGRKGKWTAYMNPPFQTACEFVDRAFDLGARKVVCFQRWAWRESDERADWWRLNPPARIWLCIDRASCYRFDIPHTCAAPDPASCPNQLGKKLKEPEFRCRECLSGTTQAHAFFVWECGHAGNQVICELRKRR